MPRPRARGAAPFRRALGLRPKPPTGRCDQADTGVGGNRQDAAPVDGARIAGIHILAGDYAALTCTPLGRSGIVSLDRPVISAAVRQSLITAVPPAGILTICGGNRKVEILRLPPRDEPVAVERAAAQGQSSTETTSSWTSGGTVKLRNGSLLVRLVP